MRYKQLSLAEYLACRVESYTGGATWLWDAAQQVFYVVPGAPVQIRQELEAGGEVVGQVYVE